MKIYDISDKVPKITKAALYTDIHFGKKNNSLVHCTDCLEFIKWFAQKIKDDGDISHIIFLGDYFESRTTLNIQTLNMAYEGLKILNELDIPILHIVGNHDLYRRTSREIHSINPLSEIRNLHVIEEPTIVHDDILSPYLFHSDYAEADFIRAMLKSNNAYGHFEFKGFQMTGFNFVLEKGPDHKAFKDIDHIFCGHFHKRQAQDNVCYIGNTFPMDFGDNGDTARGMTVYDKQADTVTFTDWPMAPSYYKCRLTSLLEDGIPDWVTCQEKLNIECIKDIEFSYADTVELKQKMMETFKVRSFDLISDLDIEQHLKDNDVEISDEDMKMTTNELVVDSLKNIKDMKTIDNDYLVKIYENLGEVASDV